ncbi:GPP34 family phosphoprotein [Streptomyces bambusae]|uniref:GPP34 family phosphoprotein n=1 Tax=Streptomyces bambusae TaxID=1550616 RepID=UPI0027E02106|nr:GPP34 family phosphoprotein [Streptomyces bambusae]
MTYGTAFAPPPLGGARPDARTAALIALIHAVKLHALAFPDDLSPQLKIRTASIASGQWASDAVRTAVHEVLLAVLGMKTTPRITTAS